MAKRNRTNTDLQHTMQTTKYRIARTPLNTGGELKYSGMVSSSCSISGTRLEYAHRHESPRRHVAQLRYIILTQRQPVFALIPK
jgi:hypothetical protein